MTAEVIAERARFGWNRRAAQPRDVIVVSNANANSDRGTILIEAFEAANWGAFQLSRFRGTADAPADVANNDRLGDLAFNAYSGSGSFQKASVVAFVDAAVVSGQSPATRLVFRTGLNNAAERQVGYFSNEGFLGLGTAFDPTVAATRAAFDVHAAKNDTDGRLQARFDGYGTSADGPYVAVAHARGTFAVPANNVDGDNLGDFEFYAYAGGWLQSAEVRAFVTGAVANGVVPDTNMVFKVATGGAMAVRMQLFSTGRIGIGSGSRATEADAAANGAGALWVAENSNRAPMAMQYSGTDVNAVQLLGRKSRGASMSAPSNVVSGDSIYEFRSQSYSGGWQNGGYLEFAVDAAVVNGQAPATRFGVSVNPNNAIAVQVFRINSDKRFICGDSMTAYTEADFNLVCQAGVDRIHTLFAQNSGGGQNFKLNFATYTAGYTNGAPASINVIDSNFSCSFRFDHKLTGASSNAQAPSLRLDSAANMPNAAFFATSGSYGSGQGVIFIGNRNTAPSSNPSAGGILYAEAGALKWRGSGGTTTTIANA